jgi:hypothetical protein
MSEEDLATRMALFDRCVLERDRSLAEGVLDSAYALVLVQPTPAVMPREAWLAMLGDYVVHEYEVEEQHLALDGDSAAVLQRVRMRATVVGEDRSGHFVLSDMWRRRPDGWRVWLRHSTPLSAGSLPGA